MAKDLLDIAKSDFNIACMLENSNEITDWLPVCCFYLQQSIEKILKYRIDQLGGRHKRIFDIVRLYKQYLAVGGTPIPALQESASMLTFWRSKSRYEGELIHATSEDIATVKGIYTDLIKCINDGMLD